MDELEQHEKELALVEEASDYDMEVLYKLSGHLEEGEDWRDKPFPFELSSSSSQETKDSKMNACNGCSLDKQHCPGGSGIPHGPHDWEPQGQLQKYHCPGHTSPSGGR